MVRAASGRPDSLPREKALATRSGAFTPARNRGSIALAYDFANVLVFGAMSVVFILGLLGLGAVLRPKLPSPEKSDIYECGEKPIGKAWFNFNPRFYVVAIIFVIFEVEIALMLPVALVYKRYVEQGMGGLVFGEMMAFLLILAVGLAWVWVRRDFNWIRRLSDSDQ
jgi:NADH-quinone oxidoreductase subunit A